MEKYTFFGEILYIGLLFEKGRCSKSKLWSFGFIKELREHITVLKSIVECLTNTSLSENDTLALKALSSLIKKNKNIKSHYLITPKSIETLIGEQSKCIELSIDTKKASQITNTLMRFLIDDILTCLNSLLSVNKKKVIMLLRAVHNLPRIYLRESGDSIFGIKQLRISVDDSLYYTYSLNFPTPKRGLHLDKSIVSRT